MRGMGSINAIQAQIKDESIKVTRDKEQMDSGGLAR